MTAAGAEAPRRESVANGLLAGLLAAIAAVDQLLAEAPQLEARLRGSPLWDLAPLLLILGWGAYTWSRRWRVAQAARRAEAQAQAEAARAQAEATQAQAEAVQQLADQVGHLRAEVQSLRTGMVAHAESTDGRLRDQDAGLRAVQAEVSMIAARVVDLERKRPAARRAR